MLEQKPSPLQSRKFIAYLLAEGTWKVIILAALWLTKDVLLVRTDIEGTGAGLWTFLWVVVLVAGFVEVGFIGGQAWLDRYVDVARITANGRAQPTRRKPKPPEEGSGGSDAPTAPTG